MSKTESKTGQCRFCGQLGNVIAEVSADQEEVNEIVTSNCVCDSAKKYVEEKERAGKAKNRITELFGEAAKEKEISHEIIQIMLETVDSIIDKKIKGITIDVGRGTKAKISRMAKGSIKVERTETNKSSFEE